MPRVPDNGTSRRTGCERPRLRGAAGGRGTDHELDELRALIAEGQERGFLTFEQIADALEEVEVTKEQLQELHAYLEEQGIDVVGADGAPATSENGRVEAAAGRARAAAAGPAARSPRST